MVTIEITIGRGDKQRTLTRPIDPDELPLGFIEDLEATTDGKWSAVIPLLMSLLDLSREEAREITMKQFKEISGAVQVAITEATTVPNA
jgi:hypothetical protein